MPIFPTPRSEHYNAEFLSRAVAVLEPQAVWLLLSIEHYAWRAHADMGYLLVGEGPPDVGGDDLVRHHFEHRVLAALEELFLVLDQLWRLIEAVQAHRAGSRFLQAYCRRGEQAARFTVLRGMDEAAWADLLRVPTPDEIMHAAGPPNGTRQEAEEWITGRAEVLRLCVVNMQEVAALFERPTSPSGTGTQAGLRDTNNFYRHGTRVLYEDCSPTQSGWIPANPEQAMGVLLPAAEAAHAGRGRVINILQAIPDADGHAQLGSIPIDAEWCQGLVNATGHLGVLVLRLARSFLIAETQGTRPLSSIAQLEWTPLGARG